MIRPPRVYPPEGHAGEDILPALRELFSRYPAMTQNEFEILSRALYVLCYLPYWPEPFEVEAALEALFVEGEVFE